MGLVTGNKKGQGLVPPENVFFCLGVEALVNQIVAVETLGLSTGSEFKAGGRPKLSRCLMCSLIFANLKNFVSF